MLHLEGKPNDQQEIWPIVQLADWGETVSLEQIPQVLDNGTRLPATGVMVFHWNGLSKQWDKVVAMGEAYRAMQQRAED